jgi:hypothetical protein
MRLANVNTSHIRSAIELSCRTMGAVFNADDHDVPFVASEVRPAPRLAWNEMHSESHVPGRHLNALLSAEDALGIEIPSDVVARHAAAAYFSYGGALPLPLNRRRIDGPLVLFNDHNLREGLHALYALARFRRDERALALARRSLQVIRDLWDPRRGWDDARFQHAGVERVYWQDRFIVGIARSIGPLVKLHAHCACQEALDLALALKEKALAEYFSSEGDFDRFRFGDHTHSTTCTLSGLALMAQTLGDADLMERVRAFYENGLWQIRDQLGWVIENADRQGVDSDTGESNNTGDLLETALILACEVDSKFYDDAELILHAHLLPSQLRDVSFIQQPPNPNNEDGLRDLAQRHLGAYGFPAPYGFQPAGVDWVSFNMDIVGGATASLVEAWRQILTQDAQGLHLNLLCDYSGPLGQVESPYITAGILRITPSQAGPLTVRVPSWSDPRDWQVDLPAGDHFYQDGRLICPHIPAGQVVEIHLPLVRRRLTLPHQQHDIRVDLRGDEPLAMDDFGADLTFFEPL